LNTYQTLCFVIIAKQDYKIKLLLNQYQILGHYPDLEWTIYDGSENQNRVLVSSNRLLMKEMVQTHENHIATIVIHRRPIQTRTDIIHQYDATDDDVLGHSDVNQTTKIVQRRDIHSVLLNITWFTSICPDDQILCSGHYEIKCYTIKQRCDGKIDRFHR
jgi:hypothetical protein